MNTLTGLHNHKRSPGLIKKNIFDVFCNMVVVFVLLVALLVTTGCVSPIGSGGFTDTWINAFNRSPTRDYIETRVFIRRSIEHYESHDHASD